MAAKQSPRSELRILLDQGFPNPPGFNVANVDRTLHVKHLQLLAYLPEVRRFLVQGVSRVIFLPKPRLQMHHNVRDPKEFINRIGGSTGVSVAQVRREARAQMLDWEQTIGDDDARLARHLGYA